ncbi:MAG: hypothetical protein ABSG86_31635 [Thermoguttaceae bacterium]|jgi:hypothetical protein
MPKRRDADQSRVHTGLAHLRASDAIMRRLPDDVPPVIVKFFKEYARK